MIEKETGGLKAKVDELLGEKKTVAQKAKEAEERAAKEREERAKQENDFKSLFESSESKRAEVESRYTELQNSIRSEKRNTASLKLATELASGTNAELLSDFIARRIDINEKGETVVLDENGNPTVSTLADLKKEITASGRYDSLIDGAKATGGGAARSGTGGAGTGTGKDLSKMTKAEKLAYYKSKREGN